MADEIPETPGAAVRNLLGAVGFILILLGGELLLDKAGDRFALGLGLAIGGIPIFFLGVFWRWFQPKFTAGVAERLNLIAADPIWWVALVGTVAAFLFTQFGVGFAALTIGALALIYAIYAWRHAAEALKAAKPPRVDTGLIVSAGTAPVPPPVLDGQSHLDLLHLFDFGIDQTTLAKLKRLIRLSQTPEIVQQLSSGDPESEHRARNNYIAFARQQLDGHRRSDYLSVMQQAEFEAVRALRETPLDQRPPGDPLNVREYAISQLQFASTVRFLDQQKQEVEDRLIGKRHQLIERRDLRNKGKS